MMFPDISVRDTISFNWRLKKKGIKLGGSARKGYFFQASCV